MLDPDLVVVDGPNLYNVVTRSLLGSKRDPERVKEYMRLWFDVDRLLVASGIQQNTMLGVVVFHSNKQLGNKNARLEGTDVNLFWARQGQIPFCATEAIILPGLQEELSKGTCPDCSKTVTLQEKRREGPRYSDDHLRAGDVAEMGVGLHRLRRFRFCAAGPQPQTTGETGLLSASNRIEGTLAWFRWPRPTHFLTSSSWTMTSSTSR